MPVSTAGLNLAAEGLSAGSGFLSLHSAAPNGSGSNEVTGGGYARQAVTWGAAAGGVVSLTGTETFDGPADGDCTHAGLWSAVSGGTFYGDGALTGDQAFNAAGVYTVTGVTITATAA